MDIKMGVSYEAASEVMSSEEITKIFGEEIYISDMAGCVVKIYDTTCQYVENKRYLIDGLTIYGGSHWAKSFHDPYIETTFIVLPTDKGVEEIKAAISSLISICGQDKTVEAVEIWEKSRKA